MGLNIVDFLSISEYHFNRKKLENFEIRIKPNEMKYLKSNLMLSGYLGLREKVVSPVFFTKVVKCNVFWLSFHFDLRLTIQEFEFLTKSGNIKRIDFTVNIYYSDGTLVPLEVLLLYVSKAININFCRYDISKDTLQKLLLMERKVKLAGFRFLRLTKLPDLDLLKAFLLNNLVDEGIVRLLFETEEMDLKFLPIIWKKFSTWEPEKPNPFTYARPLRSIENPITYP